MIVIIVVVVSILALTELRVALRNWESAFGLRSPFLFFVFCELNWLRSVPSLQTLIQVGCVNGPHQASKTASELSIRPQGRMEHTCRRT